MENEIEKNRTTKLRFLTKVFKRKEYIDNLDSETAIGILKIRLNMIEVKHNYKGKYKEELKCPICRTNGDKTEHIIECEESARKLSHLKRPRTTVWKNSTTQELRELYEYVKAAMELR